MKENKGYHWNGMMKISFKDAVLTSKTVYLLYDDNTESEATSLTDLVIHLQNGGEFGIEKENVSYQTLEDILVALGSDEPFSNETNKNGNRIFTESGADAYGNLVNLLYAVGKLTETGMEHVVEVLDQIANED